MEGFGWEGGGEDGNDVSFFAFICHFDGEDFRTHGVSPLTVSVRQQKSNQATTNTPHQH